MLYLYFFLSYTTVRIERNTLQSITAWGFRQHVCSEQGLYAEEMLYQTVQPDMDPVLIEENQNEF